MFFSIVKVLSIGFKCNRMNHFQTNRLCLWKQFTSLSDLFKTEVFDLSFSGTMRLAFWTKSLPLHIVACGCSYRGLEIRLGTFSSLAVFMEKQANHCCNYHLVRSGGFWHLVPYHAGETQAREPACEYCRMRIFWSTAGSPFDAWWLCESCCVSKLEQTGGSTLFWPRCLL